MWTRQMLKINAKQLFQKNYWVCVGVAFILSVLGTGGGFNGVNISYKYTHTQGQYEYNVFDYIPAIPAAAVMVMLLLSLFLVAAGIAFYVFVVNVIEVGGTLFFIWNRTGMPPAGTIFAGFRSGHYKNIVKTMFLKDLYVFLWSLLLIIPGIIKSYEYFMVPYILAENPGMDSEDVFALSRRMMDGEKWDTFVLNLSFLGWELLSAFTCGMVGIFYVNPYCRATYTELYAYNKIKAYNEGYIRTDGGWQ